MLSDNRSPYNILLLYIILGYKTRSLVKLSCANIKRFYSLIPELIHPSLLLV
jgi:hypothetical protein